MVRHRFEACVGDGLDDAWFLAQRYEATAGIGGRGEAPDPRQTESWVGRIVDGKVDAVWGTRAPLLGLAPGREGEAYAVAWRDAASGALGEYDGIWRFTDAGGRLDVEPFVRCDEVLHDLRPLADGSLVAWTSGDAPARAVVCLDGAREVRVPPPPFRVSAMGGASARMLVAGSHDGRLAVWDGAAWRPWDEPLGMQVWAAVASLAGEAFAASFAPDRVARWDGARWQRLADAPNPVSDLCVYQGALYAAVAERGLYRLEASGLVELPLPVTPKRLYAGARALVMTEDGGVADSSTMADVRWVDVKDFAARIDAFEPLWRTAALDSDPSRLAKPAPRREVILPTKTWFARCVGDSFDDAYFLASRTDDREGRFEADEAESVVGRIGRGVVRAVTTTRVRLHDLGRAPSGRLYVAAWSRASGLWRTAPDGSFAWERLPVPAAQGLFVLDDACVMVWGGDGDGQRFHLFDGRDARPIPSPPERVMAVHGCAPDFIVAVGHRGMVARWDGLAWTAVPLPVHGALGAVHVVSPDEMYATGPCGVLFEGTRHGWAERAPCVGGPVGVAKFKGEVYVGDLVEGLLRLEGDTLVPVDLPVFPGPLHAGADALLLSEQDGVAETRDMKQVRRVGRAELDVALRNHRPLWRR